MPIPNFSKSVPESNEHLKRKIQSCMCHFSPCQQLPLTISVTVSASKMWCVRPKTWGAPSLPTPPGPSAGSQQARGQPPGACELQAPQYLTGPGQASQRPLTQNPHLSNIGRRQSPPTSGCVSPRPVCPTRPQEPKWG